MLARIIALLALMFGHDNGMNVEIAPLEWPFCALASVQGRRVIVADDLYERCGPLVAADGIDIEVLVAAHEGCHHTVGITGDTVIDHGPAHQQCTEEMYQLGIRAREPAEPVEIINLY